MRGASVLCPRCGSPMRIKTAYRGRNAGRQFYSCTKFPRCKGTRSITKTFNVKKNPKGYNGKMNLKSSDSTTEETAKPLDSSTKEKFIKLVQYYKECVQVESLSEIKLWQSDEGEDFIQCPLDKEWLSSGKETYKIRDTEDILHFGRKTKWKKRPTTYYYSYPIFIQRFIRRDTNKKSAIIMPFLIFPVSLEKDSTSITIKRSSDFRPQVNAGVLNMRGIVARPEQKRVFIQKLLERWDDNSSYEDNFQEIASELKEDFGIDNYIDADLDKLISKKIDLEDVQTGFYATGLIFITQGSKYTFGLEEELDELEQKLVNGNVPSIPVMESIINRQQISEDNSLNEKDVDLVEITPLNDEQRQSIQSAFKNKLSVITGPPGTGKSQVVINIIANAVARDENVLFGSKNHQAVDVVLQRIYEIQEQPIILKFGQNAKESLFAGQLLTAVDRALSLDESSLKTRQENFEEELENIVSHERETWLHINKCYQLRNSISQIDSLISSVEGRLPKELTQILMRNNQKPVAPVRLRKLKNRIKKTESGKIGIIDKLLMMRGITIEQRLTKDIKAIITKSQLDDEIKDYFMQRLENQSNKVSLGKMLCDSIEVMDLYLKCFKLRKQDGASVSKVLEFENHLSNLQKNKLKVSPKYIDVLMSKKFKELGASARKDIADYTATVKRIEEDRIGGTLVAELRKQKKQLFSSVVKAFPAIAVTNLSIRHVVPLDVAVIDLVVIDEASQCDIASALPMLLRAKRAVIIGDEKQLIHVSNISKIDDQQLQSKHRLAAAEEQRFLYSSQSLFDLCKSTIGTSGVYTILKDHFRSRAEIVQFSNQMFYGNQLRVWTDYRQLKQTGQVEGIIWHDVKGRVIRPSGGSAYNLEEVKKTIDVLRSLIPKALEMKATMGIVTPFREQANKIRDAVFRVVPVDEMEALDLKPDTAHRYQGDERDIIIFSPVVSSGMGTKTKGFLVATQNLFNVAITRPRAELHIVGDREACANSKIEYLEKFVQYVNRTSKINLYEKGRYSELFDSKWEKMFYNKLKDRGINTTPQLAIHQYKLDLAIEDHDPPIDIEIDGEAYHRDITGERCIYDVKRDIRLTMMGWLVKRFWVYELKYDLEKCLEEIEALINKRK